MRLIQKLFRPRCQHEFVFTDQRFEYPASGNFLEADATNAECVKCGERVWAHRSAA